MRCFEIKIVEEDMVNEGVMVRIREAWSVLDLDQGPVLSVLT